MPRSSQQDTPSRSSPGAPGEHYEIDQLSSARIQGRHMGYFARRLADPGVSTGDDDDLSGQIWDVILRVL